MPDLDIVTFATAPTQIPGLKFWFSSIFSSKWQDSTRFTPASADGDPVGCWEDMSGNGYHIIQTITASKPTLKTNIVGGKPVIRFDGTDDYLISSTSPTGQTACTLVILFNPVGIVDDEGIFSFLKGVNNDYNNVDSFAYTQKTNISKDCLFVRSVGGDGISINQLISENSFSVVFLTMDGVGTANMYINGTSFSDAYSDVTAMSPDKFIVSGRWLGSASTFGQNDICEIMFFDRVLSSFERLKLTNYFVSNPSGISGLQLWLAPESAKWQDSARTTLAVVDTDPVGAWDDISGNNNHALQTTGGNKPTLKLAIQNNRPVLRFVNANNSYLTCGDVVDLGTSDLSIFVVKKSATYPSVNGIVSKSLYGGAVGRYSILSESTTTEFLYENGAGGVLPGFALSSTDYMTISGVLNRSVGTCRVYQDGILKNTASFTAESTNYNNTYALLIGAYNDSSGNPFAGGMCHDGDIGEVLIYKATLTDTQIDQIHSYLRIKWGTP